MGTQNSEAVEAPRSAEEIQTDKAAFEQLLPLYREMEPAKVRSPRLNVRRAALHALIVADRVNQPDWSAEFAALPAARFDRAALPRLAQAARGALYAQAQAETADALSSDAKLPASLARDASTLCTRMFKVATYHLEENEEVGPLLEEISAGTGYLDMAEDLWRLAQIYRAHVSMLATDRTHYIAEDAEVAERFAKEIKNTLRAGTSSQQRESQEMLARAWTLLLETYEQVAAPGRWLFAGRGGERLFVSLYAASRRAPRPNSKAAPVPTAQPQVG